MKSWLYKLFGLGKIGEPLSSELKSEEVIAWDEGVKSTLTYKNFRAPERYSNWKRRWFSGAVALTKRRLILRQYSRPVINLELTDARLRQIKVSREADDVVLFEFAPNLFLENSTGEIEWRFRTAQAEKIAERLTRLQEKL
jgi:hypothetical protein